ncbi:PREDICTED: cytochrome b5-like [Vollenhovia emeryi]|uniref:cytochrome b5-like n=1 Tax=Vollenhovia emeryi TaxID=411798 RepID=UPI0005F4A2EA|nr:PREDICTED: cytochrome b5-like [Vollenhovia emeryi]XP_011879845.1 PREDICTED: cytochrome b5-like [Vollenhovia emeryi]
MVEKQLFTRAEVAKTNDKDKVLFILHDKVYNVRSFLNEHPGGEEVLLDHKGMDGSEDFDDVGHSKDAMELMKKYQVGVLVESEKTNKSPKKGWVAGYSNATKTEKYVKGPGVPFYLLMGGIALVVGLFFYAY